MDIYGVLEQEIKNVLKSDYSIEIKTIDLQTTRKDFKGDVTLVVFPYLKYSKISPEQMAQKIGECLKLNCEFISEFNVVKGFLNLSLSDSLYIKYFHYCYTQDNYGFMPTRGNSPFVMVEYSSPNTNKPLHLGHIRNNLLGSSIASILKASGKNVLKTQIINDRGIHICKSMVAWQKFGNGETPENTGVKGDKLVGKYYTEFDRVYKKEVEKLVSVGLNEEQAKKQAPIMKEAQKMLVKWESKDIKVISLWKKMNRWVYDGFDKTYHRLGVDFDFNYYESNTYSLGKELVLKGVKKGVFYQKKDGSIWVDLADEGLDEKLLLRSDGTAVYITQDIGTAIERAKQHNTDEMIYTVGNEQDHYFKVLFLILKKLGYKWADKLYHLSYGMVDLPSGKMKSREGNVIDADDLMEDMVSTAHNISQKLGKLEGYSNDKKKELYQMIGLGALKYHILKVDPKKRILFNPEESIDFNGNTGPFIQYTYARIQSILRRDKGKTTREIAPIELDEREKDIIKQIKEYPEAIQMSASTYNPSIIVNYTYSLVKKYNTFYQNIPIMSIQDNDIKSFRVKLSNQVGKIIKSSMGLLGINVPDKM